MSDLANLFGPLMVDCAGRELTPDDRELLAHPLVGGFILFTRNFETKRQIADLVQQIRSVKPEILIAVDYEGGRVQRFREEFTRVPPMRRLGDLYTQDPAAARNAAQNLGWLIASELGEVDIDLALTPVVDLEYDRCAVIGDRAFHRDPKIVVELASAVQKGLAEAGMAATAKHFPGHGAVVEDSHHELPVDGRSWDSLADDIAPYRDMVNQGLASVMMAHIRYPALDNKPASLSAHWIKAILRGQLGFSGVVFCDDLSMGGAAAMGSYTERARLALDAGCDVLPVCNNRAAVIELLDNLAWPDAQNSAQPQQNLRRKPVVSSPDTARLRTTQTQIDTLNRYG